MTLTTIDFSKDEDQSEEIASWLHSTVNAHPVLRSAFQESRAGILLADISEGRKPRWAAINPDLEIYGASVPKLATLLGVFYNDAHASDARRDVLTNFQTEISLMIKKSDNLEAGKLYALTSFASIKKALEECGFYQWDEATKCGRGGMWCGAVYSTTATKKWFTENPHIAEKYPLDFTVQPSPKSGNQFALTARAGASFLVKMESGQLINERYSALAKNFMEKISTSKFLPGITQDDPNVNWFGKTGTFEGNLSEVTLIEGRGYKYVLALLVTNHRSNDIFEYIGQKTNRFIYGPQ